MSVLLVSGYSTIAEKTTFISGNQIESKVSGVLGYAPDAVTILNRCTSSTDTYVEVGVGENKTFGCMLNGGNLISGGIINTLTCVPKA